MDEREFELAEKLAEAQRDDALDRHRRRGLAPADWDQASCTVCGEEVTPTARLKLGYWTCLTCQTRLEHKARTSS